MMQQISAQSGEMGSLCMEGILVENADNVRLFFVFCCFMIYRRALSWQFASIAPTRHRITGHYMI
jgi:hypothetical protein